MQIQTGTQNVVSFRPSVAPPVRGNGGPTGTNLADTRPPSPDIDEPAGDRRDRFGDALLRRLDAGDLRGLHDVGREFRFAGKLINETRREVNHELRDGARDLIRGVKKELRSVLRELGDDKQARKAVRSAFKDFRRDVKDVVKDARSSRQFDVDQIAADLEAAYTSFGDELRDTLGTRKESVPLEPPVDPANGASVAPTGQPDTAGITEAPRTPPASVVEAAERDGGEGEEVLATVTSPPASVAETRPDPRTGLDRLFGRLDAGFKEGLGNIVTRINDALDHAREVFDEFRSREHGGRGDHGHRGRLVDRAA